MTDKSKTQEKDIILNQKEAIEILKALEGVKRILQAKVSAR